MGLCFFTTGCRVRATSASFAGKRREESRRGTQECVRHNEVSNLAVAREKYVALRFSVRHKRRLRVLEGEHVTQTG
jgi:hypothetical protein